MMNEKWTPGPWFAHGPINPNRRDYGVVAGNIYNPASGAQRRIAWVGNASAPGQSGKQSAEVAANAALIAAAPDLHDAANAVLLDPHYQELSEQTKLLVFAAVAKANGYSKPPDLSPPIGLTQVEKMPGTEKKDG